MELLDIQPTDNNLWQQVWRVYIDSFPEHERRRISSHMAACENRQFCTQIAIDNGNFLALLFYWNSDKFIYLEHLAVNPAMRGRNVGTELVATFLKANSDKTVILEIEPPVDELTQRRLRFYQRIGFIANSYPYIHPSYSKNGKAHNLEILSYPNALSQSEFDEYCLYMKDVVLKYID